MYREDLGVYLTIISSGRALNVRKMIELVGQATWYVGAGESDEYRINGARHVFEGGGLIESRNMALDHAGQNDYICVQLSDDLTRLRLWRGKEEKPEPIDFKKALATVLKAMQRTGFIETRPPVYLGGAAVTDNAFFSSGGIKNEGFILGDFMVIRPSKIRFDSNLRLKEDYDFTLQHLQKFGKVARVESILPSFAHRKNKGGAVAYRTSALEKEAIAYLMKKWPGKLRMNPKRADEVILV